MPALDLFGLTDGSSDGGPDRPPSPRRVPWRWLAAADAALALVFLGALVVRVRSHLAERVVTVRPAAVRPAPRPEPRKPAPPAAKPQLPSPNPAKPAARRPAVPLGSPAMHAAPAPRHAAALKTAAAAKPAAAAPAERHATRPVPFSYEDPAAKEVYVLGPFLVRTGGRRAMYKDSKGVWRTTIYLNVGQTYKYRFEAVSPGGSRKRTPARKVEVMGGK